MSGSKANNISAFIQRHVHDAMAELALENPQSAEWILQHTRTLEISVSFRMTRAYGMLEMSDIFHWKEPRKLL